MERKHEKYERLIARCKALPAVPTAVAHPCDESSLKGAVEAAQMGLMKPILVGPRATIEAVARVPIILTSRADSVMTRLASCAVAALVALARRENAVKAVL